LYGAKNWRESTFVFTLDANEEGGQNGGDNYFHCMCIIVDELYRVNNKLLVAEKAFCLMAHNTYFPLH
jgi:hypothetical protein